MAALGGVAALAIDSGAQDAPAAPDQAAQEETDAPRFSPAAELELLRRGGQGADRRVPVASLAPAAQLSRVGAAVGLVRAETSWTPAAGAPRLAQETGTGVLVAPCLVLTARHVLGSVPSAAPGLSRSIDVRFARPEGFEVRRARLVAEGPRPDAQRLELLDDWAVLELDAPASAEPAPLPRRDCCPFGVAPHAALIGFPADRFDPITPQPWADTGCAVTARLANHILATSCHATSGNSGGPVLVLGAQGWEIAGVLTRAPAPEVRAANGYGSAYAVPMDRRLTRRIAEARAASACPDPRVEGDAPPPVLESPPPAPAPEQRPEPRRWRWVTPWRR